jgi:hypothetical protein
MAEAGNPNDPSIDEILRRVITEEASGEEIDRLRSILADRGLVTASGSGAIAIGGSVSGSDLTTNVVQLPHGMAPEAALALLRRLGIAVVEVPASSLPRRKTTFTGRRRELDDLVAMLAQGTAAAISAVKGIDRKSTRLNSSHRLTSRMPSSA